MSYNNRVLQQIRTAFRRHKPDLLLYVNRFDDIGIPVGELPVLKGLSRLLGPSVWLNTLVALTHATSPLPAVTLKMRDGSMATHVLPFEQFATKRAHILQTVIREASADQRLMNPMVYVDTAPGAYDPSEVQGQGRSHPTWGAMEQLLLMVVAAKLLADTEVLVQAQSSQRREAGAAAAAAGGGPSGASLLQQMYGPAQLPIPYLLQSAIQAVQPVRYPEHDVVMGVLGAKQELLLMKDDPHQVCQ